MKLNALKYFSIVLLILFFSFNIEKKTEHYVYLFLHDACLISQYYTITLDSLHKEFGSDEIKFIGVFPNGSSDQNDIDAFKNKYDLDFQMYKDQKQILTKKYGATVTPEVFVVEVSSDEVLYSGRIDDSYFRVGKRRTVKTTSELYDVLLALKEDREIEVENTISIGCIIQELE